MDDDRFVSYERSASFVITPDALRLWIRGGSAENTAEHIQRGVDSVLLIDGCPAVALDAWHEQDGGRGHPTVSFRTPVL